MDPQIVVRATGDFRRLYSEQQKAESRFGRLGAKTKAAMAGAAIAGTAALVKFGVESVKAASASQQSIGATESVFGKYADTVIKRSKQASDAVGLSANEYRELANVTGASLASTGLDMRRVTGLTDKLTKRAADMAATFGGTTKEAIEAVSSLLRGEADPIERYGVSIKQSDVNARLAAKGLDKLTGSARKQAEQQARLDLLFKQTRKSAGQFARESDTLAGAQQRLGAKVEDLEASFGELLLPILTEVATWAGDKLVPTLQDLQGWIADNRDEIADFGNTVKDTAVPPLKLAVDVAQGAVKVFGDLPGPVKELAVQAGVAALVLPRLTTAITGAKTSLGGMVTNLRNAEKRTAAMGTAVRNLAGVGGMLALAQGAQTSNESLKILSEVGGGALLGFSLGGPIGAAIGGSAGALAILAKNAGKADKVAFNSKTTWQTYADTLDHVTGATTRATKSMIIQDLQQSGLLKKVGDLGISQSTLVNGILGQKKAREDLAGAIGTEEAAIAALREQVKTSGTLSQPERGKLLAEAKSRENLIDAIKGEVGERKKATKTKREELLLLQNFPDEVITKVQTEGAVDSKRELAELVAQYGLTPKQIRTVIKMNGVKASKAEVEDLAKTLVDTGKVKPADDWQNTLAQGLTGATKSTRAGRDDINALLGGAGSTKPNLSKYRTSMSGQLDGVKDVAYGEALAIGRNIGAGVQDGIWASMPAVRGAAIAMASQASAAARTNLGIHSPSRVFRKIGKQTVAGFVKGIKDGRDGIDKELAWLTRVVEKSITGKGQARREKAVLKRLHSRYRALRINGNAQDRINKKLAAQRDRLKELKQEYRDYAAAIKQTIVATGDITQLGRQDDETVTIKGLIDQLTQKANAAERFDSLVTKLAKEGLSRASIQQMLDAGPAAALATAEAIEYGGKEAIQQINALQTRLAASGESLSSRMAKEYYGAGVDAARGIISGLEAQAKQLDKAAVRMANKLVKAVKKALGIRSPSKEFRDIADQVTNGLTYQLRLNDTYVKRSGEILASSLVKGFSTPQLDASVLAGSSNPGPAPVRLTLTADQVSRLQRGGELIADIDYARSAGVRARTF